MEQDKSLHENLISKSQNTPPYFLDSDSDNKKAARLEFKIRRAKVGKTASLIRGTLGRTSGPLYFRLFRIKDPVPQQNVDILLVGSESDLIYRIALFS